jgi:hypothetical protein
VRSVVTTFAGYGLNVIYVPSRNFVDAVAEMSDAVHPNDTGHRHLRDAFEAAIQPLVPTPPSLSQVVSLWSDSFRRPRYPAASMRVLRMQRSSAPSPPWTFRTQPGSRSDRAMVVRSTVEEALPSGPPISVSRPHRRWISLMRMPRSPLPPCSSLVRLAQVSTSIRARIARSHPALCSSGPPVAL